MSSLRNAVQRRNHKERAQPLERQKWGILEKHKDYSLRAKDHNEKKKRLRAMRQKAAERNPDEFAFGMMSSTTKSGVKVTQRGRENGQGGTLGMDVAKLLKTQDAGYLQTVLQQTRRERERAEKEVLLAENGIKTKGDQAANDKRQTFENGVLVPRAEATEGDMDDMEDLEDDQGIDSDGPESSGEEGLKEKVKARRKRRRLQEVLHNRLGALRSREKELSKAVAELDAQRAKMSNTVGGVNKNGVKFKIRERKR